MPPTGPRQIGSLFVLLNNIVSPSCRRRDSVVPWQRAKMMIRFYGKPERLSRKTCRWENSGPEGSTRSR